MVKIENPINPGLPADGVGRASRVNAMTDEAPAQSPGLTPEEQARGRRLIVWMACISCTPSLIFSSSMLLLFLTMIQMDRVGTLLCLSIPALFAMVFQTPFAHWADRRGKKRLGYAGISLMAVAYLGLLASALATSSLARPFVVTAVVIYSLGSCLYTSGWFALMMPMIPEPVRASFFGRMRVTYQFVALGVGLACSALLEWRSSSNVFGGIFVAFLAMILVWLALYGRLPEAEKPVPTLPPFGQALGAVARARGYLPFCAYAFLLALFTGGCPFLFGLIEKTILHLSDGTVALLANVRLMGAILGFYLGGKAVARFGTKPIFLSCHFGFGLVLFAFLWRDAGGGPLLAILGSLEFLFGLVMAASSVAFTVEMYALIPPGSKSLSTSLFITLQGGGAALSGMLAAWAIRLGVFRDAWTLAGAIRSDYDVLLLIYGTLVVVVAVTLGLVPSVVGQAQWMPRE